MAFARLKQCVAAHARRLSQQSDLLQINESCYAHGLQA